uniref:UDP-glucuronosyltransferase n=1 Tax=Romanomermis culicivorax TaxID=13658 RepID=A0A915HXR2_ROMCU
MPHPWSYVPALYIPNIDYTHKRFASRLASVWTDLKETISVRYTDHILHQSLSKYHPDISLHALYNKPRLAFKASPMLIDYARPRTRDMIYFGGTCSKKPHSIRDPELKSFIQNNDSDGTIVIAFGHGVRWQTAPEIVKRNFANALNRFTRYRIVWQFDGDSSGLHLGKHIKCMAWIPQEALLLHPNTKLFITHGGIKSTTETICAGVPAVVIPFFAEQIRNAHLMAKSGCGLPLLKSNLTTLNIVNVLKKVLKDESFSINVQKLKSFFIDRPMDFIDEGTFWTEFVIRRKNCEKWLISRANNMPFVKRLMIDTFVVVLLAVMLFLYVLSPAGAPLMTAGATQILFFDVPFAISIQRNDFMNIRKDTIPADHFCHWWRHCSSNCSRRFRRLSSHEKAFRWVLKNLHKFGGKILQFRQFYSSLKKCTIQKFQITVCSDISAQRDTEKSVHFSTTCKSSQENIKKKTIDT